MDAFSLTSGLRPPTSRKVGAPRLELGTSALSGLRSNQLSYAPGGWRTDRGGQNMGSTVVSAYSDRIGHFRSVKKAVKRQSAACCQLGRWPSGIGLVCDGAERL